MKRKTFQRFELKLNVIIVACVAGGSGKSRIFEVEEILSPMRYARLALKHTAVAPVEARKEPSKIKAIRRMFSVLCFMRVSLRSWKWEIGE